MLLPPAITVFFNCGIGLGWPGSDGDDMRERTNRAWGGGARAMGGSVGHFHRAVPHVHRLIRLSLKDSCMITGTPCIHAYRR